MISDLDETIKKLLIKKVPLNPAEVDISFEMPGRDWSSAISKPTVNIYLYDVHENHELREYDWTVERNGNNTVTKKRKPIMIDLSYLITVWSNAIEDEHGLLWHILGTLFKYPTIPEEVFQGELIDKDYTLSTKVAQPDGMLKNPADFWGAFDNRIKPSIQYVVTMPLDLDFVLTAPIVSTRILVVRGEGNTEPDERIEIKGLIYEKGKPGQRIPGATLFIKEIARTADTDDNGCYTFHKLSRGKYTIRVQAPHRKERELSLVIPSKSYDIEL